MHSIKLFSRSVLAVSAFLAFSAQAGTLVHTINVNANAPTTCSVQAGSTNQVSFNLATVGTTALSQSVSFGIDCNSAALAPTATVDDATWVQGVDGAPADAVATLVSGTDYVGSSFTLQNDTNGAYSIPAAAIYFGETKTGTTGAVNVSAPSTVAGSYVQKPVKITVAF